MLGFLSLQGSKELDRLYLEERLATAARQLAHGDPNDALRSAVAGLTCHFDKLLRVRWKTRESLFRDLCIEWPKRGIQLNYGNRLTVVYEREEFDVSTVRLYFSFISNYIKASVEDN